MRAKTMRREVARELAEVERRAEALRDVLRGLDGPVTIDAPAPLVKDTPKPKRGRKYRQSQPVDCPACGRTVKGGQGLASHMRAAHPGYEAGANGNGGPVELPGRKWTAPAEVDGEPVKVAAG